MKMHNHAPRAKFEQYLSRVIKTIEWQLPLKRCGAISLSLILSSAIWGCTTPRHLPIKQAYEHEKPTCERIITADVIALEQVYYYNRFGSFNPAGLMYALRRDVVIDRESLEDGVIKPLAKVIEVMERDLNRLPEVDQEANRKILEDKKRDQQKLEGLLAKLSPGLDSASKHQTVRKVDSKGGGQDKSKKGKEPEIVNEDLDLDVSEQRKSEVEIPSRNEGLDKYLAGHIKLRSDKRPRPLVLRANEEDCLYVTFTNLLAQIAGGQEGMNDPEFRLTHPDKVIGAESESEVKDKEDKKGEKVEEAHEKVRGVIDGEEPATRHASMHVNGLSLVSNIDLTGSDVGIESQGVNVGKNGWQGKDGKCSSNPDDFGSNLCALAAPGETRRYQWYAKKEGTYFFYSMGAPAGGEGDGGQLGLGLFGAVNVQPKDAKWYRSQVTKEELVAATKKEVIDKTKLKQTKYGQPVIDYDAVTSKGYPILNMLKETSARAERPEWVEKDTKSPCAKDEYQYEHEVDPLTHRVRWTCVVPAVYEIVHSDLNAVIDIQREEDCDQQGEGNACGKPYREFTVIFHDEVTAVQAFKDLDEEDSPLSSLRDGMGINYGASGLGPMVVANRKGIGPSRDCVECKLEEFFLTSWVHGDPAMVVGYKRDRDGNLKPVTGKDGKPVYDANGRPLYQKEAKYPDDPSNVHHSYLGDPVRFRNMHAGPKETHVFHLHAHQWVEDKHDATSHYLDSQTISPGSTFSYEVHYGGSGNRNLGPGDSIFHCHLYPHFAQGMWELWRTHDVFENGHDDRKLPDYEIEEGTPNPAVVPLPRTPLPPMPAKKDSDGFRGYPFYIAAQPGHRPPQPPLDLDGTEDKGTLRRHIIIGGTSADGIHAEEAKQIIDDVKENTKGKADRAVDVAKAEKEKKSPYHKPILYPDGKFSIPDRQYVEGRPLLYEDGKNLTDYNARRVYRDNQNGEFFVLARQLTSANIEVRPDTGTDQEKAAMQFHAGTLPLTGHKIVNSGDPGWTHTDYNWEAPGYSSCLPDGSCDGESGARVLFRVNGGGNIGMHKVGSTHNGNPGDGVSGAPFSNPCPKQYVAEDGRISPVNTRKYRATYIQMDMTVNKAGWHDPQARFPVLEEDVRATLDGSRPTEPLFFRANSGECVEFYATNLIPSNLNLDDFQVYSPTDTIGQHIHLVKFDVTSSDGSGNGWNYEDGTFAADEIRERILANNAFVKLCKEHPENSLCPTDPKAKKELSFFKPKTHPIFLKKGELGAKEDGALVGDTRGYCSDMGGKDNDSVNYPWCGAQTTIQRWWADPVLNGKPGGKDVRDRTLRTVFTHDHFGPSSHQHHGFYAALVVEPTNSKWSFLDGRDMGGVDENGVPIHVIGRQDGGPTSYAANIIVRDEGKACLNSKALECSKQLDNKDRIDRRRTGREYNLAFADFAIVYTSDLKSDLSKDEPESNRLRPVNPPNHVEGGVLNPAVSGRIPSPEGISTKDPGTQLINYRNEPIPLRLGEWKLFESEKIVPSPWSCVQVKDQKSCFVQRDQEVGDAKKQMNIGDMAHVFSSKIHESEKGVRSFMGRNGKQEKTTIFTEPLTDGVNREKLVGRQPGDPATPLLQAYDGDRVQIRLIQGAQEEQHVFTMHGARWLTQPDSENSGYVNAQHIGISEHFEFNDRMLGLSSLPSGALGHGIESIKCQNTGEQPCRTDLLFSSSAIDNLWDGQWGLMRIYPAEEDNLNLNRILARLPGRTDKNPFTDALSAPGLDERLDSEAQPPVEKEKKWFVHDPVEAFCKDPARKPPQSFFVEAWMAKDLLKNVSGGKGLVYNKAFNITDPHAILFVERKDVSAIQNGTRKVEPLILRAHAGDCIEVTLTNRLPAAMPDDHRFLLDTVPPDDQKGKRWQKTWSYNMLPPIIEGFNFNQLRSSNRVGLHAGLVDQNTRRHDGAHVGFNEDSTVGPHEPPKTYLWYAGDLTGGKNGIRERPIEFGAIPLTDQGDVIKHPAHGAIGALIIEPQCSKIEVDQESNASATVTWWEPVRETSRDGKFAKTPRCPDKRPNDRTKMSTIQKNLDTITPEWPFGKKSGSKGSGGLNRFKEFVLLYQDALALQHRGQPLPNLRNGDDAEDSGQKAFNYRTEPLWARLGGSASDEPDVMSEYDWSNVLSSKVAHEGCSTPPCDPETPIFQVDAGEPVRFRVVHPGGHPRQHALAIFGHNWSLNPWTYGSSVMGWNEDSPTRFGTTNGIGPARHLNIQTRAGGDCAVPGDYLYRTQEGFMFGGGLWGILRVNKPEDPGWWRPGKHHQKLLKQDENACKVLLPTAGK